MPSAPITQFARITPRFSTSAVMPRESSCAATKAWPSSTSAPSFRARFNSAWSRSLRVAIAAKVPPVRGSSNNRVVPEGERTQQSCASCQDSTFSGSKPSSSNNRSAPVVRPSPQILSRGNSALSMTTASMPALAKVMAAADPAGPPPTMRTSTNRSGF